MWVVQRRIILMVACLTLFTGAAQGMAASPGKTVITFLARDWPPELEWEREVIAQFEKENPNIDVDIITYPAGGPARQEKLALLWASGNPPDVWGHGGPVKTFDVRGWLLDMSKYVRRDHAELNAGDFFPAAWNAYRTGARQWGLSMNSVGTFMVYNRNAFAEAALAPPPSSWDDPGWSYEVMVQAARKLTQRTPDNRVSRFGLSVPTTGYDALMWSWYWGGDWFDARAYETGRPAEIHLTDPGTVASLTRIVELMWDLRVIPGGDPWDTPPQGNAFLDGKVGMSVIPGWSLSNYIKYAGEVDWGLAAMPQGRTRANLIFTDPWLIGSRTKHPEEAWKLVKFLVREDVMASYVERMSFMPARTSAAQSYVKKLANQARMSETQVMSVLGGAQEHGRESIDHTIYGYETIERILDPTLADIYARQKSPREALVEAQRLINAALRELQ